MPSPRMPTGTVSGGSNGSRTFPIRDEHRFDRPRDAASDASESNARTDGRGGGPPTPEAEVERLRAENEDLRRALRETRERRQDVIDRYERLLDGDSDAEAAAEAGFGTETETETETDPSPSTPEASAQSPPSPPRTSPAPTTSLAGRVADELDAQWTRLRRRYNAWQRQTGL
ncbi:hypothetical protein NDI76_00175 [Halogeometricum sp. S1BR25-6]|uniref:Uncharacterized protein n=1 Tax=Halogeometricum salsisoli TaxID=2950536 RepID=A0ABU2G8M5_9EURY|nr:hypothetical protein [Halogeometricum sp. S1BR25-6]MDS0297155.1 hypothetical protein [Halogeometricum sp. S1BR25-6]